MQRGMEAARLDIENNSGTSEEVISTIFRGGHTIKGSAYIVAFNQLGDLAKEVESISRVLREGDVFGYAEVADALQAGHEAMTQLMKTARGEDQTLTSALQTFRDFYLPLGLGEEVVMGV